MKANLYFFIAVAALSFAACNNNDDTPFEPKSFTELVKNTPSDKVWVQTNMSFNNEKLDFNGSEYNDVQSYLSALRVAGYTPDTTTSRDNYDTEKKTFGYEFLVNTVFVFSKLSSDVIISNYFTDEFAIYNTKPLHYYHHPENDGNETVTTFPTAYQWASTIGDTIVFTSKLDNSKRRLVVIDYNASSFTIQDPDRYRFKSYFTVDYTLRPKSEVVANGLTWVNDYR